MLNLNAVASKVPPQKPFELRLRNPKHLIEHMFD